MLLKSVNFIVYIHFELEQEQQDSVIQIEGTKVFVDIANLLLCNLFMESRKCKLVQQQSGMCIQNSAIVNQLAILQQGRTMQLSTRGGRVVLISAFNLVARQQWNFPSHVRTLYSHLRITSVSTLVGCGQLKPVWSSLVCMANNSIMWIQHHILFGI